MAIDNSVYLKHIRDAIYRIEGYVSEMSKDEFLIENNEMARAAVVRELVWDILVTDLSVLKDQVEDIVGTS